MFEADRDAQQALSDAGALALGDADPRMRRARRMRDRGFHVAQIRGDRQQPGRIDERPGSGASVADFESDDAAEAALLAARERVLRMRFQSGVMNLADALLTLEPARQLQRGNAVRAHAQLQRFQSLQEHPGVERAHARPRRADETEHVATDQLLTTDDGAADAASLSVEILGRRVDHEIRAELERLLQRRRAEAV